MSSLARLGIVEWHDLPLDNISINHDSIKIDISAIVDGAKDYRQFSLELSGFTNCSVNISGDLNSAVLKELEVAKFDYKEVEGLLSGSIGILPGNAGYWSVDFENAKWVFDENT